MNVQLQGALMFVGEFMNVLFLPMCAQHVRPWSYGPPRSFTHTLSRPLRGIQFADNAKIDLCSIYKQTMEKNATSLSFSLIDRNNFRSSVLWAFIHLILCGLHVAVLDLFCKERGAQTVD